MAQEKAMSKLYGTTSKVSDVFKNQFNKELQNTEKVIKQSTEKLDRLSKIHDNLIRRQKANPNSPVLAARLQKTEEHMMETSAIQRNAQGKKAGMTGADRGALDAIGGIQGAAAIAAIVAKTITSLGTAASTNMTAPMKNAVGATALGAQMLQDYRQGNALKFMGLGRRMQLTKPGYDADDSSNFMVNYGMRTADTAATNRNMFMGTLNGFTSGGSGFAQHKLLGGDKAAYSQAMAESMRDAENLDPALKMAYEEFLSQVNPSMAAYRRYGAGNLRGKGGAVGEGIGIGIESQEAFGKFGSLAEVVGSDKARKMIHPFFQAGDRYGLSDGAAANAMGGFLAGAGGNAKQSEALWIDILSRGVKKGMNDSSIAEDIITASANAQMSDYGKASGNSLGAILQESYNQKTMSRTDLGNTVSGLQGMNQAMKSGYFHQRALPGAMKIFQKYGKKADAFALEAAVNWDVSGDMPSTLRTLFGKDADAAEKDFRYNNTKDIFQTNAIDPELRARFAANTRGAEGVKDILRSLSPEERVRVQLALNSELGLNSTEKAEGVLRALSTKAFNNKNPLMRVKAPSRGASPESKNAHARAKAQQVLRNKLNAPLETPEADFRDSVPGALGDFSVGTFNGVSMPVPKNKVTAFDAFNAASDAQAQHGEQTLVPADLAQIQDAPGLIKAAAESFAGLNEQLKEAIRLMGRQKGRTRSESEEHDEAENSGGTPAAGMGPRR